MPYNNTPIAPSKEITGTVWLPLARVKKIIAVDDDIANCSNNAAFVITLATEMFLQHLVEQSYNIVKSERKPRRNVQYRDVANAVARIENLEFLADVVPKTTTYRQFKQKTAPGNPAAETAQPAAQAAQAAQLVNGQSTLDAQFGAPPARVTNGGSRDVEIIDVDDEAEEEQQQQQQQRQHHVAIPRAAEPATLGAPPREVDSREVMDES